MTPASKALTAHAADRALEHAGAASDLLAALETYTAALLALGGLARDDQSRAATPREASAAGRIAEALERACDEVAAIETETLVRAGRETGAS